MGYQSLVHRVTSVPLKQRNLNEKLSRTHYNIINPQTASGRAIEESERIDLVCVGYLPYGERIPIG